MHISLILMVFFIPCSTLASESLSLRWHNLNTANPPPKYNLPELTDNQQRLLRQFLHLNNDKTEQAEQQATYIKGRLMNEGIDAEHAIIQRQNYMREMQENAETTTTQYDGKHVRILGFVTPIKFSENMVATELLLTPAAGACIHTPPPPVNQSIRVTFPKGYKIKSLQYPVWVEGEFTANRVTKEAMLIDGKTKITTGYELKASDVESYYKH